VSPCSVEVARLLVALGRAGIELAPHPTDASRLRHRPADLPPDLSALLRIHRAVVLALLAGACTHDTETEYLFCERLGIAAELGMPTDVGTPAWLIVVGEALGPTLRHAPRVRELRGLDPEIPAATPRHGISASSGGHADVTASPTAEPFVPVGRRICPFDEDLAPEPIFRGDRDHPDRLRPRGSKASSSALKHQNPAP